MPRELRSLFATIISNCQPSNPLDLFNFFENHFIEDFINAGNSRSISIYLCLREIQAQLDESGFLTHQSIEDILPMPELNGVSLDYLNDIMGSGEGDDVREGNENQIEIRLSRNLNDDQRAAYNAFLDSISNPNSIKNILYRWTRGKWENFSISCFD